MKNIGFIGCGIMGGAIAKALSKDPGFKIFVHDTRLEQAESLARETGATACSFDTLMANCSLVVLAVKPQVLPSLYTSLRKLSEGKRWISLAAGVALETLAQQLMSTQIVRIMPNIAAQVGKAVTAILPHPQDDPCLWKRQLPSPGVSGAPTAYPKHSSRPSSESLARRSPPALVLCMESPWEVWMKGFRIKLR